MRKDKQKGINQIMRFDLCLFRVYLEKTSRTAFINGNRNSVIS